MDQLADKLPNGKTIIIGQSWEGRDLKLIKISLNGGTAIRPAILVAGVSEASDLNTASAAIYAADMLVNGYNSDPNIKKVLNAFDVYIMPLLNPDGYHYARTVVSRSFQSQHSLFINHFQVELKLDAN